VHRVGGDERREASQHRIEEVGARSHHAARGRAEEDQPWARLKKPPCWAERLYT
jgi:hypothetical protein